MALKALLVQPLAKKVPELTIYFWIIKVLTTGMGEATSDFFVHTFNPYLVVVLGAVGLAISLALQLSVRRYQPWLYWLAVSMVAVFGTMAAGILHVYLGVPYIFSATIYGASLAVIFVLWYLSEKTLSVHSIDTRRRELFYWAAVLATFALGTAAGDMTAVSFHLGFFASGILFAVVIAIPALAYRLIGLNEIAAFWFAYIITRPLGASFADWLAVPGGLGGLNFGRGTISLSLNALIIAFVAYLAVSHRDVRTISRP
ncbi:MAG TPA: hypothetical protein VET65_09805 [Candidatus Limnocylindrales bacterium]|nr:hypothetical protein [Candidatus Limnocylindrales bacterium]